MTKMAASALTHAHLGRRVRIVHRGCEVTSVLRSVSHQCDMIEDSTIGESAVRYVLGRPTTTVHLLGLDQSFELGSYDELTLMT